MNTTCFRSCKNKVLLVHLLDTVFVDVKGLASNSFEMVLCRGITSLWQRLQRRRGTVYESHYPNELLLSSELQEIRCSKWES